MLFVLRKTKKDKGLYLQIYKSEYDITKKYNRNSIYKTLGYCQDLVTEEITDPVEYYTNKVKEMNIEQKFKEEMEKNSLVPKTSRKSLDIHCGYYPLKKILDSLNVGPFINFYADSIKRQKKAFNKTSVSVPKDLYSIMTDIIMARVVDPCSKYRTFTEVLPRFGHEITYTYDNMLDACEFVGEHYNFFTVLMAEIIQKKYGNPVDKVYFDCTNYYFEIDREDDLRRKGPSKENRKDPIVGMGLLLNRDLVPINMRMYPGNQNESPVINQVINEMKDELHIDSRTIRVADKGLNNARNIYEITKLKNDGYIFSKSVKKLSSAEKTWVFEDLDKNDDELKLAGWFFVNDNNGNLIYRYKETPPKTTFHYFFETDIVEDNGTIKHVKVPFDVPEKRIITYNPALAKKQLEELRKERDKAIDLNASQVKREEYGDYAKYVIFVDENGKKATTKLNTKKIKEDEKFCGYNLLVTSETKMNAQDVYKTYHQLWRIEETFRTLKSQLDARPVYLQKPYSIIGHFVLNFMAVQLLRLFQFYELKNKYGSEELCAFIRELRYIKVTDNCYMSLNDDTDILYAVAKLTKVPLTNKNLSNKQFSLLNL